MSKKVCLFGTSANPPTGKGGHRGIVEHLLSLTSRDGAPAFDEIRVLPVYRHMFDNKRGNQASYEDRIHMCKLTFGHIPRVVVSDQERECFELACKTKGINTAEGKHRLRVGTAELLEMLLDQDEQRNENVDYTFALGTDTFMDLTEWKWRRSRDIIEMLQGRLVVFRRDTISQKEDIERDIKCISSGNALNERIKQIWTEFSHLSLRDNIRLTDVELLPISSSAARETTDMQVLRGILDEQVLDYIQDGKMYAF